MKNTLKITPPPVLAIVLLLCAGMAACGGPQGGSTLPPSGSLGHSVLTVVETRNESIYDAPSDSLFFMKFESALTHYGRIAFEDTGGPVGVQTFNDSLRLREKHPFRIHIFMSSDTLFADSDQKHGAAHQGGDHEERAMLECLFEGPALTMSLDDGVAAANIDHLKSECAGGLYKRLDLPRVLPSMIFQIAKGNRQVGARWQAQAMCPSFAGLGLAPLYPVNYRIEENTDAVNTHVLVVESELPIGNLKTTLPNNETADIVGGRYRLQGRLVVDKKSWVCVGGFLAITEEISYVRPALGPAVLKKDCDTRVTLTVRWDS